jgi:hypothetical protein
MLLDLTVFARGPSQIPYLCDDHPELFERVLAL